MTFQYTLIECSILNQEILCSNRNSPEFSPKINEHAGVICCSLNSRFCYRPPLTQISRSCKYFRLFCQIIHGNKHPTKDVSCQYGKILDFTSLTVNCAEVFIYFWLKPCNIYSLDSNLSYESKLKSQNQN